MSNKCPYFNYCYYCKKSNNTYSYSFARQLKEFTLSELSQYDGTKGKPAYVAVNGIVYDISNEVTWASGTHFGLYAGKDLTAQFKSCHDNQNILKNLPTVGMLKP